MFRRKRGKEHPREEEEDDLHEEGPICFHLLLKQNFRLSENLTKKNSLIGTRKAFWCPPLKKIHL